MPYMIRHKKTKKLWMTAKNKASWDSIGAAKNAWANYFDVWNWERRLKRFKDSEVFNVKTEKATQKHWATKTEKTYDRPSHFFDDQSDYEIVDALDEKDLLQECLDYIKYLDDGGVWDYIVATELLERGGR